MSSPSKTRPLRRVTLTAPNGQVLPPAVAGTFISSDPHYVIFSVDHPQSGAWQLNVTGSGRFLMDSLKLSTLGLSILAPASDTPEPLGQPLTVSATLNDNGTPITGSRYSINGTITYSGGGGVAAIPRSSCSTTTPARARIPRRSRFRPARPLAPIIVRSMRAK